MNEELQIRNDGTRTHPYVTILYWRDDVLINYGEGQTATAALTMLATRLAHGLRLSVNPYTGTVKQVAA